MRRFATITASALGIAVSAASLTFGQNPVGPPPVPSYRAGPPPVPTAPTQPQVAEGWVNGKKPDAATPAAAAPAAAAEDPNKTLAIWPTPPEGIPDKFEGPEIVARIGTEFVLASDLLPGVEDMIQKALAAGQIQEDQVTKARHQLMRQKLAQILDTKMLLVEARRAIPKENLPKIEKKVKEIYEKEQIPKLINGKTIKSRAELIEAMTKAGTSLEEQQRTFFERSLASQYLHQQVEEEKEITHDQMLAYYREHLTDFETPARARWEHVMVRASNYPSKPEAYAKIAEWGNLIFRGTPLADVARQHSDDISNDNGGLHEWTAKGALASETIDQAIFSLPIGQLSPILEDERGFHIVRVVERQELSRKQFGEVQAEIKKKIKGKDDGEQMNAYLADLRKKMPVWTIFDSLPPLPKQDAE